MVPARINQRVHKLSKVAQVQKERITSEPRNQGFPAPTLRGGGGVGEPPRTSTKRENNQGTEKSRVPCTPLRNGVLGGAPSPPTPTKKNTGDTFRSYVLGVMSPARYLCATPVYHP